jgi:hypothetical protein
MATYFVSTSDGRVHQLDDVTDVELVVNDGVATVVYDGVWRNTLQYPAAASSAEPKFGPGWSMSPDATAPFFRTTSTDPLIMRPSNALDTAQPDIFKDDILQEEKPRYLEIKKSYWKFTSADGPFFFPMELVTGMGNNAPTY